MTVVDPVHLFEQAERLVEPIPGETEARQADLRRAVSAAYYGIFHFVITTAVDLFVGSENRESEQYSAAYRTVKHAWLSDLCEHLRGSLKPKKPPHAPGSDFFGPLINFATNVAVLQELRHSADYDPSFNVAPDEARIAIKVAREAVRLFQGASEKQRVAFLTLLLFDLRKS